MRIFYDVDTQKDFMDEGGALYVPGAEGLKPNLAELTAYAREKQVPVWGSVDNHPENDPEFKVFPPHCVEGTKGQEKIPETLGEVRIFEKTHYDVFTNPEIEKELAEYGVKEAVVYGVATDYCVQAAVLGMQERGVQTYVVEDAIAGVGVEPNGVEKALKEMKEAGAKFVTTRQVLEERL